MDDCREFVDNASAEDGVVRVHDIHDVEGYKLHSHCGSLAEGHMYISLAKGLYLLPLEAYQRILCFLDVLFCEAQVVEALSSGDVY